MQRDGFLNRHDTPNCPFQHFGGGLGVVAVDPPFLPVLGIPSGNLFAFFLFTVLYFMLLTFLRKGWEATGTCDIILGVLQIFGTFSV